MATATTTVTTESTRTRTFNRNTIWVAVAVLAAVFAIAIAMTAQRSQSVIIDEVPATAVDSRPGITPGQEAPVTAPGVDTTAPQNTAPATDTEVVQ